MTSGGTIVLIVIVALISVLGIWTIRDDRKARRAPLEVQEDRLVKQFEERAIGVRPATVSVDLGRFRIPHDRIKEIGAEHGYEFDCEVKSTRAGWFMRFKLKGPAR